MTWTLVIYWIIMAYLFLVQPVYGKRLYQFLKSGRLQRMRFYLRTVVMEWTLTVAVVALAILGNIPVRLIGLVLPRASALATSLTSGVLGGAVIGLVIVVAATLLRSIRRQSTSNKAERRQVRVGHFDAILPRTSRERLAFAGVAVTAGVCEEVLFRGLPVFVLFHQFPSIGPLLPVLITAVLFGLAHYYQGWKGVIGTGVIGAVFAGLFVATGSLLLPIILHVFIDLRAVFIRPVATKERS